MRKPVIAGNWKMYKTRDEALQFIYTVNKNVPNEKVEYNLSTSNSFKMHG